MPVYVNDNQESRSENAGRWSITFVALLAVLAYALVTYHDRSNDSAFIQRNAEKQAVAQR